MIEELQRRHMVVTGIPAPLQNANVVAGPSSSKTPQPPESSAPETGGQSEPSDAASVSGGETYQT